MRRFRSYQKLESLIRALEAEEDVVLRARLRLMICAAERELALAEANEVGALAGEMPAAPLPLARLRQALENASPLSMLIDPRAGLHIVDMTEAYAEATLVRRAAACGERLFDLFPDNTQDGVADGVRNLYQSIRRAAETLKADRMAIQRYDVRDASGAFVRRYWQPINTPLLDDHGALRMVLHQVSDVTPSVVARSAA